MYLFAKFIEIFPVIESSDQEAEIPPELQEKLEQRQQARKEKNYPLADQLRDEIESAGYKIVDTSQGSFLERQ